MMRVDLREANVLDAAAIAKVHVDSWRTTYAGVVPEDFLAQLSYEQHEHRTERPARCGRRENTGCRSVCPRQLTKS